MKIVKWLGNFFACLCACLFLAGNFKDENQNNQTHAHTNQGFLDWDFERKLIYAYENSILIVADGAGTTIYLDVPTGHIEGQAWASGDGVLTDDDLSLAELYEMNPTMHAKEAPENGADLSEWSIVFGGENLSGGLVSEVAMSAVMTGGKIKNIYAGHSSLSIDVNNTLKSTVKFKMTGGEISTLYTDSGYDEDSLSGIAKGATNISFDLSGGTINSVIRKIENAQGEYNSIINLSGNIKLIQGIKFLKSTAGIGVKITDTLASSAKIVLDLNNSFELSEILIGVSETIIQDFDVNNITLKNIPENATTWQVYKNGEHLRFGVSEKIESVSISGNAVVGQTLTANIFPESAPVQYVTWHRVDAYLNSSTIIGSGTSYTLKEEDGGKFVYAVILGKNNLNQKITCEYETLIKRIDEPEVVKSGGVTTVYANGNDLIVASDGGGSTIYLDLGTIGVFDAEDISLKSAGIANAFDDGTDLSNVIISAGCSNGKDSGDIAVTLVSGKIKKIIVSSTSDVKLVSNIVINLFGGTVNMVEPNKNNVGWDSIVNVAGNVQAKIYGVQHENGATKINIVNNLTSGDGKIAVILDKSLILEKTKIVECEEGVSFSKSTFTLLDDSGNRITTFNVNVSDDGIELDPIKVESAKLQGKLKVGKTLKVETTPINANVSCQWFRSFASIEDAEAIDGANSNFYKLTSADEGKYIFVVINKGDETEIVLMTENKIKKAVNTGVVIVVIVGVIVLLAVATCVWFILWKKQKVAGGFMTRIFEKLSKTQTTSFKKKEKGKNKSE